MGLFDSWRISCEPRLHRNTFFPGNLISGELHVRAEKEVEFVGIRVHIIGTIFQQWRSGGKHKHTHTLRAPVSRISVTVAGAPENSGRTVKKLPAGDYRYPFSIVLPQNALPSFHTRSGHTVNALFYQAQGVVDLHHSFDSSKSTGFVVLLPVPLPMWQQPSSVLRSPHYNLTCCCCVSKGSLDVKLSMSKTIIALDRDAQALAVAADIDNTHGKEEVRALVVALQCTSKVAGGLGSGTREQVVTQTVFEQRFPCQVAAGSRGQMSGVMRLHSLAPASFTSRGASISYRAVVSVDVSWASDPQEVIDIFVAHAVQEPPQQQQQQPMMMMSMLPPDQRFASWAPMAESASPIIAPNSYLTPQQQQQMQHLPFANFAQDPQQQQNQQQQQQPLGFVPGAFFSQQPPPGYLFNPEDDAAPPIGAFTAGSPLTNNNAAAGSYSAYGGVAENNNKEQQQQQHAY